MPATHPLRNHSGTASVQASQPGWLAHCPETKYLIIPQFAKSGYNALRKCYAYHESYIRPYENTIPTIKSTLNLTKIIHLPLNSNLTNSSYNRANRPGWVHVNWKSKDCWRGFTVHKSGRRVPRKKGSALRVRGILIGLAGCPGAALRGEHCEAQRCRGAPGPAE